MNFYSFAAIRQVASCIEIAQELYGVTVSNGRCAAAWRGGDNPEGVAVTRAEFYDHVNKHGGGPVELAAFKFNGDMQQAQEWLGQRYGLTPKATTRAVNTSSGRSRYDQLIADGYAEVARYEYRDTAGTVRHVTIRLQHPSKPGKEFVQGVPQADNSIHWGLKNVDTILYRLPDVSGSDWAALVEGEKSADRMAALGLPATTAPMGAGKWRETYSEALRGKAVAIFPDNDDPGREHAELVARSLHNVAASVRIVPPAAAKTKGGIDDWVDETNPPRTFEDVLALVAAAPDWLPVAASSSVGCDDTGPTPEALEAAKNANKTPFRNYVEDQKTVVRRGREVQEVTKLPRDHRSILDDLGRRFLGFPRILGRGIMFDHDRDSNEIVEIHDADDLLSWIARKSKHNPDVTRGDAMPSARQIYASIIKTATRYEAVSKVPDWPRRDDVYYSCGPTPPADPQFARFRTLVDFFLPATELDRNLIASFICCPLWYRPGVSRPSWVIDSRDGQGSGKTVMVELVAELYGAPPITVFPNQLREDKDRLTKRLVSKTGRDARILLVDNVVGEFRSPELSSLITEKYITGMAPYGHGEEVRLNNLTYCITANNATVTTDLADRCIYVHVRKPAGGERFGWKERIQTYIEAHRMEIIADMIAMLSSHSRFAGVDPRTRFPEFEVEVMQPCCGDADTLHEVMEYLMGTRAESNTEEDQARSIREAFEAQLDRLGVARGSPVFIRSEVAKSWGFIAIKEASATPKKDHDIDAVYTIRNLAKIGMIPEVDQSVRRWPSSSKMQRFNGIAWNFHEGMEDAPMVVKNSDGNIVLRECRAS